MAISGSASEVINAPIDAVYAVAADPSGSPRWQPEFKSAEVLETDADGQQTRVKFAADIKVRTVDVEMHFSYAGPSGMSWQSHKSAVKIKGSWAFEDLGDGTTRATYDSSVDLGRLGLLVRGPMLGALRSQLFESMPGKLKTFVEENRGG